MDARSSSYACKQLYNLTHWMAVDVEYTKINELAVTVKTPITIYQTLKYFTYVKVLVQISMQF